MNKDQNVNIHLSVLLPTLHLVALQLVKSATPVHFFKHLKTDSKPIATKSKKNSRSDSEYLSMEVKRLLREGLINSNTLP